MYDPVSFTPAVDWAQDQGIAALAPLFVIDD